MDALVAMNEHAMFSADRHTVAVARRLRTDELVIVALVVAMLAASSYFFARTLVVRPLKQLVDTLREIDNEQSLRAMSPPRTAELATLADEFNAMVGRLERDYRLAPGRTDARALEDRGDYRERRGRPDRARPAGRDRAHQRGRGRDSGSRTATASPDTSSASLPRAALTSRRVLAARSREANRDEASQTARQWLHAGRVQGLRPGPRP